MRRAMLAALSVIALALASPGAALAHHGHRGHHHKRNARAHHARVHFEHFGAPAPAASDTVTGSDTSTGSTGEETKTASPAEIVGTVASFENEVLTITLNDGSTVKGKVTSATEIECLTMGSDPSSSEEGREDDKGSGDDQGGDREQQSSDEEGQSKEDGSDDDAETAAAKPACGMAALTQGTGVREAELKIGPGGAEFESIELVK
jgi:hypothetical protein